MEKIKRVILELLFFLAFFILLLFFGISDETLEKFLWSLIIVSMIIFLSTLMLALVITKIIKIDRNIFFEVYILLIPIVITTLLLFREYYYFNISFSSIFIMAFIIFCEALVLYGLSYLHDKINESKRKREIKIDSEWHYNPLIVNFIIFWVGITLFVLLYLLLANYIKILSEGVLLVFGFYIISIILLLAFMATEPLKYKVTPTSIELYWLFLKTKTEPITDNWMSLFNRIGISQYIDPRESIIVRYPKHIDVARINLYWLGDKAGQGGSIIVSENGNIVITGLLGWTYHNRVNKVLPSKTRITNQKQNIISSTSES